MSTHIDEFMKLFKNVKNEGFIETHRKGNTGIGKTFEDCCNIVENNLDVADFQDIEIKSQRNYTGSYITLFTKAPSFPKKANTYLRENFGSADKIKTNMKVLHTSIFANRFNTHRGGYGFKLFVDYENKKVTLLVKDLVSDQIINDTVYWSFSVLKEVIETKLKYIAFVQAKTKKESNVEYFNFNKMVLLSDFNFEKFLTLLENGTIMFDIRIGIYRSGRSEGKTHDHGSGFRISKSNLNDAFTIREIE